MDWAAAGVWQEETYTGGNRQAGREPTARGSEGGRLERYCLFLSPSRFHTLVLSYELAHPRDPRVWGGNPGRLPLEARFWGEGSRGREDPRSSLGVWGSGELGARAARCADLSPP